jgi:hypothetical protein
MASDAARFDAIMSQGRPFGDSAYIREQTQKAYKHRIRKIGGFLPAARQLLDALDKADAQSESRVLCDPVVRAVIQQALTQIVTGSQAVLPLEQCADVFHETLRHLEAGVAYSPLESGAVQAQRLGSASHTPWIWSVERSDDVFGRSFEQLVQNEYGESLCTPTSADVAMLDKATGLLHELVPLLSRSALSHVQLIGVFPGTGHWENVASSSQFRMTGAIFLNKTTLKNPWWVAEHLLHESLHQKLYEFRHAHSLLARDDENASNLPSEVCKVVSLWNTPGLDATNVWDPHRAIAAFHVYVHLALFCALAEQRAPEFETDYGRLDALPAMTYSRRAFERARYLGENLHSSCWPELGFAGQRLVEWLGSILDALDPNPPPPSSCLHLFLDRYLLEAASIQQKLHSKCFTGQLAALIRTEARSTKSVLAAMGAQMELGEFSTVLANYGNLDQDNVFPQIRRIIAKTLLGLAPDGYSIRQSCRTATTSPDEMVKEMVEASSHELAVMGAVGRPHHIRGGVGRAGSTLP